MDIESISSAEATSMRAAGSYTTDKKPYKNDVSGTVCGRFSKTKAPCHFTEDLRGDAPEILRVKRLF